MLALNENDWVMMLTLNRNQVKLRINTCETLHCLTWFMDPTQHLDWSGAVQLLAMFSPPLSVIYCNIFMLCHWASLWNWPTNWPETRLTPDSTCRIIFRSQSGSQSALNAARLKCKWSAALTDHKGVNADFLIYSCSSCYWVIYPHGHTGKKTILIINRAPKRKNPKVISACTAIEKRADS